MYSEIVSTTADKLSSLTGFGGEFSQQAYDYLIEGVEIDLEDYDLNEDDPEIWFDFMFDEEKIYAVAANGPITSWGSDAVQVELDEDSPAYKIMISHIEENELRA